MTDVLGVYFLSGHSVDSGFFLEKVLCLLTAPACHIQALKSDLNGGAF